MGRRKVGSERERLEAQRGPWIGGIEEVYYRPLQTSTDIWRNLSSTGLDWNLGRFALIVDRFLRATDMKTQTGICEDSHDIQSTEEIGTLRHDACVSTGYMGLVP